MSNRRRPPPPPRIARFARRYRCADCNARAGRPRRRHGIWHLNVRHEPTCPALTGRVPTAGSAVAALRGKP